MTGCLAGHLQQCHDNIVEDLLEVMPLHNRTRGEDIYDALIQASNKYNIPLYKMVSLITDGDSVMIGNLSAVGARILRGARKTSRDFNLLILHCVDTSAGVVLKDFTHRAEMV